MTSCDAYPSHGFHYSGIYRIFTGSHPQKSLEVYCDLETDDHGWIVIQRRVDNTTDFDRGWNEYKKGFGDLRGNYWIGLDNLNLLAGRERPAILRIDLRVSNSPSYLYHATYNYFVVDDETTGYRLIISDYQSTSTLKDYLSPTSNAGHNGMEFTTKDKDNDEDTLYNCASQLSGGWWFRNCRSVHLNGIFPYQSGDCDDFTYQQDTKELYWNKITSCGKKITFAEMKIRYINSN